MVPHKSSHGGTALADAVRAAYSNGQTDYNLTPLVAVNSQGDPLGRIKDGDSVVFCCRRGEREVELTEAFTEEEFSHFIRPNHHNLTFVILTLYHEKFKDLPVAFAPGRIKNTLGEVVSQAGKSQLRIAESEKYAHITFFLNGGNNQPFPGETDLCISSPKTISFDQCPELSLPHVAREVISSIHSGVDFIITNFANGDVIGHTTNRQAKIDCAEAVDKALANVVGEALAADYGVVITADHGNLEELYSIDGSPHVSHTTNPVPLVIIDPRSEVALNPKLGCLADIAPTVLTGLGIPVPSDMTGKNLVPDHVWGTDRHLLLIILDGWGVGSNDETNPIHLATTPFWDDLYIRYLPSTLTTSGQAVGLRATMAGNSEAGHMNIGAGQVILQDDVRLDLAMNDGTFFSNEIILKAIDTAKQRNSDIHLIGLLSEKSSHGSIDYPLAVLRMAKDRGMENVYLHVIFDGRSTQPGTAPELLEMLEKRMDEIGIGKIISGMGRGIALDRDGNYGKIKQAFDALVYGIGEHFPL